MYRELSCLTILHNTTFLSGLTITSSPYLWSCIVVATAFHSLLVWFGLDGFSLVWIQRGRTTLLT